MATKLKNLKVKKVDFVDEGANPDAHIELFKRKDGKPEENPKKPKEDDEEGEKQNEGGVMKRLLSAIAKMVGINPGELNSAIEEIEKGNSESFKEKMAQRKAQKIADEIWDFCYALQSSLCSVLWDEDLDGAGATAAMIENLDEFYSVVKDAIGQWSDGKVSNIAKNDQEISEEELAVMKSAQVRLNEAIQKASEEKEDGPEDDEPKGDGEEMKIDKSKMTESERAFFESIEKRYGTEEGTGTPETPPAVTPPTQGTAQSSEEAVAKALQTLGLTGATNTGDTGTADIGDDIFKGLNPGLKAQVEALIKFKADAEEKEMKEICKRYAILGKTEEELLPVLKSTKAVSQEAYDQVIKTLDDAKAAVENSGTFSEIGKSGHAGAAKGADTSSAEGKIASIAKSYVEKNPTMNYVDAVAKAWEDNPELVLQYEEEAGL